MIARDELYRLVWSEPMTRVAERFKVSGSHMARVCDVLDVPRPPHGHWAKLAVGKAGSQPPLPEPQAGTPLAWARDGSPLPRPAPAAPRSSVRRGRRGGTVESVHPLIRGAKALLLNTRPVDEGAYLKPFKRLLVDVTTSQSCVDGALALAGTLFRAFEAAGHRVAIAPAGSGLRRDTIDEREQGGDYRGPHHYPRLWSPDRPTVVSVGTVAFGLAVVEMSERATLRYVNGRYMRDSPEFAARLGRRGEYSWTTNQEVPSGRLRVVAYSPYGRVAWSQTWQEGVRGGGIAVGAVVRTVAGEADGIVARLDEARLRAEAEHAEWLAQQER